MQPDATALRFKGRTITWTQLDGRVTALAGALHRRGVGSGDRVMILMLNRPEFIEATLAANRLGAIAVPVNFRLTVPELAYLVENCGAAVVLTEPALVALAAGVRDIASVLATVIVAEESTAPTDPNLLGYEDLLAEEGEPAPPIDICDASSESRSAIEASRCRCGSAARKTSPGPPRTDASRNDGVFAGGSNADDSSLSAATLPTLPGVPDGATTLSTSALT